MYMKKLVFFVVIALILTGCTKVTDDLDNVVQATMTEENLAVNIVSTGYELYIPAGVLHITDNDYNQKFEIKNRYVYLYVDTISYFYKNTLNYKSNSDYSYYYKKLQLNDKVGYIGVNKIDDDNYYCEIVYNYSKIEFYSKLEDLPVIMANSLIIQNSIKFNDNLISMELGNKSNENGNIKYELDKPDDSESTFSRYLQEYVTEEEDKVVLPDED